MRAIVFLVMACGLAALVAQDLWDKGRNYVQVDARILSVDEVCYMQKREGKQTSTSNTGDCATAESLVAQHPAWQGYTIYHRVNLTVAYTSPVDRQIHKATHKVEGIRTPKSFVFATGKTIAIRASKTDPAKIREA